MVTSFWVPVLRAWEYHRDSRIFPRGALLILPLALLGCGATEIRLSADRTTISAGGIDAAKIAAEVYLAGDPAAAGTTVSFETTGGTFEKSTTLTSTSSSTNGQGRAEVTLFSAATQGAATVTASFSDSATGLSASSSITITFGPPAGSTMPVDGTFRLTCDAVNIGALREPIPDIRVTCRAMAQTRTGQTISSSALSPTLLAEAGTFTTEEDPSTGNRILVYSPKAGGSAPADVTPDPTLGEPSRNDPNGLKRNPRDGLVTLVAVVDGEEAFTDLNGNGKYDQGEPFTDAAEPFVDLDDNDHWDPSEKYLDVNGNGRWDAANGKWDASTKIMALYKILWTGPLDSSAQTSRISRTSTVVAQGGKIELAAYTLDANMNPVAAFQANSDTLEWSLSSDGDAGSNDPTSVPLGQSLGFAFDKAASTERKRWMVLSNSFVPPSFKFTVQDQYPTDTDPATHFSVTVATHSTPGPTAEGSFLEPVTELFKDKVEGTCN
jgi:hypothetical protein